MTKRPTAKTPTVTIARVLKDRGLVQGQDFRVRGQYARGERTGTYVVVLSNTGEQIVADNADHIEQAVKLDGGFTFYVSIHYTTSGRMWTWIANYGMRTREMWPRTTGRMAAVNPPLTAASRKMATDTGNKLLGNTLPGYTAKLAAPRPAFGQPDAHPYEGLAQKTAGALTWACEEAGEVWFFQNTADSPRYTLRVYNGRARVRGWYLTGPGVPPVGVWMGGTWAVAAAAAEDTVLGVTKGHVFRADWSAGTRVSWVNEQGHRAYGTIREAEAGSVTKVGHPNFGRSYVGVYADPTEARAWRQRTRVFTDLLTRI